MERGNDNQKVIDSLNTLIQINNDRIQGYLTASEETDQDDLKGVFSHMVETSQNCRRELAQQVMQLGGTPTQGTTISGKLFRAWMDVKSALASKDRKAILNSCEFGEDVAVKTYETEIEGATLDGTPVLEIVKEQHAQIKSGHDKIKELRDNARSM